MQNKGVMNFRMRLKRAGYKGVKIKVAKTFYDDLCVNENGELFYDCKVIEPLLGYTLRFSCTESEMNTWPKDIISDHFSWIENDSTNYF